VSPKKKTMGQGKTSLIGNLTASMPWLKNKTFLIPALASVLALSVVGAVLAVQATNSLEVSLGESSSEAVDQPAIGFACVAGTVVCEEVKDILLETDYEEVLRTWTRSSLIDYIVGRHGRSLNFVTEVVDAVRFDWGDGSTYIGDFESDGPSASAGACVSGEPICDAARYVLVKSGQGKNFTRENFIEVWMSTYGATRAEVEGIISAIGFTDWAGSTNAGGSGAPSTTVPPPPTSAQSGLSPSEEARSIIESINAFGSAYSRLQIIDYMVSLRKLDRTVATSALDGLGVNWNLEATKAAGWYATRNPWTSYQSKVGWQEILEDDLRFTASEAEYAINSMNLDWNAQASRAGKRMLEINHCMAFVVQSEFGPSADVDDLASYIMGTFDFTEDEAYYGAMDQVELEGDWVWKIFPNCVP
jgi:hypothetical protein